MKQFLTLMTVTLMATSAFAAGNVQVFDVCAGNKNNPIRAVIDDVNCTLTGGDNKPIVQIILKKIIASQDELAQLSKSMKTTVIEAISVNVEGGSDGYKTSTYSFVRFANGEVIFTNGEMIMGFASQCKK